RLQYFSPMVRAVSDNGPSDLLGALMPGVQKCRALAQALLARAMLRLSQGARDAAWQDLLACHRLARLVGRGATLIDALVGIAIDSLACRADLAFLADPGVDARQIEKSLHDLDGLPPLP